MATAPAQRATAVPNDLEAFWIPFTPNRAFKAAPRLIARAKDMHYYTPEGRAVLDGTAGMWCTNAGHNRDPIVAAIRAEAAALDYAPAFQFAHPKAFELASRVAALAPGDLDHVFFCNSGSEAVDTALKIALAYHNVRGEAARTRLIGRERGYHGVGFGGISVGGIVNNRKLFGALLAGVDHLPATYNREHQAFSKGEPEWGAHLADELERIVALHDASTIAAVIVEPMAGSTGVLPRAEGLPAAAARDLRQARHPADLRRGHHRLRPARPCVCRRALRRQPRHDHVRQGHHLGHRAHGRRDRAQGDLRRLHARTRCTWPSCSTAIPIRRIRSRARPGSRRSNSTAKKACSSAHTSSNRSGPTPRCRSRACPMCSTSAASGSPPASTSPRGPDAVGKRAYEAMDNAFHRARSGGPRRRRDPRAHPAADRERARDRMLEACASSQGRAP